MSTLEPRIFVICYDNGNFHSMTADQDLAWQTARKIGGWIGELSNVHKARTAEEILPPEQFAQVLESIENADSRVRRGRPVRKTDIDNHQSGTPLDPPSAA